eukprot:1354940-Amorphochlora_amoeboformis.AAC.1
MTPLFWLERDITNCRNWMMGWARERWLVWVEPGRLVAASGNALCPVLWRRIPIPRGRTVLREH